jgi:16S rRNA (guanine527-N7)-methyltransferase
MFHVKQSISLEQYFTFLEQQNIALSEKKRQQFGQFLDLLLFWARKQNLISRNDLRFIVERHFLPCSFLVTLLTDAENKKIIDIGSGAGFPGIVVAILMPENLLTLIDSSRKKYLFLQEVRDLLVLDTELVCQRVENFTDNQGSTFDFALNRAVASLAKLWSWSQVLLKPGGTMIAMKGGELHSEIDELGNVSQVLKVIDPHPDWIKKSDKMADKKYLKMEKQRV